MVTRETTKEDLVARLHSFIMQYNAEIGRSAGLPADQVQTIMNEQSDANKLLCEHIADMLIVEGYVERV